MVHICISASAILHSPAAMEDVGGGAAASSKAQARAKKRGSDEGWEIVNMPEVEDDSDHASGIGRKV